MTATVRALVVPANAYKPAHLVRVPTDPAPVALVALRKLIGGGWLEGIGDGVRWHGYCDEEAKLKHMPVNPRATRLAHVLAWPVGDILCGDVIFLGNGPAGEEADVPQVVLDQIEHREEET